MNELGLELVQSAHEQISVPSVARSSATQGLGRTAGFMVRRYGIAFSCVGVAFLFTLLLRPFFHYPFFFLFFPAVMAAAWFGGPGPGLFGVLLSTLVVDYFLVPPFYSFAVNATDVTYFTAFVLCALAASWISSIKKKREESLLEAQDQLQVSVAQRTAELAKSHTELQENERQFRFLTEVMPQQLLGAIPGDANGAPAAASLQDVLAGVVEFSTSVVKCDSCFVYVLEDDELILRASKNPHPEIVDRLKMKMGEGITGWVAEHRQPVTVSSNAWKDERFQRFNELPEDRFEAFLSVPVASRGRLVGVINLQNREPYHYSEREIRLLSTIGFLVGAEIEMARLENENSRLSDKLETRKLVERAKGVLQRELDINEQEAYLTLQKESRQRRKSMREIAEAILLHDEIKGEGKPANTTKSRYPS
jgi:putative methionine-R-sulfoxide reductase with GAF domain